MPVRPFWLVLICLWLVLFCTADETVDGIGCGDAGVMLSKDQLDGLYCGPGRTSCTSP